MPKRINNPVLALDKQRSDTSKVDSNAQTAQMIFETSLAAMDSLEPVFLDANDPRAELPTSVTIVTARELFDMQPGETVSEAAARWASRT
nr:hypothetical protein [Variovorax boronicumulans]